MRRRASASRSSPRRCGGTRSWSARRGSRGASPLALALLMLALSAAPARPAERWEGLVGLDRVAVEATVSPLHPEVLVEDVRRRVEEAVRRGTPALAIDNAIAERLHLVVSVRAYSSADLRGYWLPLSQLYGIGPVRLVVERPVTVSGGPTPLTAQVWQAERQAAGPWHRSGTEILELTDQVVAAFVADYHRALGR